MLVLGALLRRRMARRGFLLVVLALPALVGGAALGAWAWHETRLREVRGSPTIEFTPKQRSQGASSREEPWPTYGRDLERTHFAPFQHRPPYQAGLAARHFGSDRVSTYGRVRAALLQFLQGALLRPRRGERAHRVGEAHRALLSRLAHGRAPGRLPGLCASHFRASVTFVGLAASSSPGMPPQGASSGDMTPLRSKRRRCSSESSSTSVPGTERSPH